MSPVNLLSQSEKLTKPRMLLVTWNSGVEEIDLADIEAALASRTEDKAPKIVTEEIRKEGKRRVAYEPNFAAIKDGFSLKYADQGCWVDDIEKKFDAEGLPGTAQYTLINGSWKCVWFGEDKPTKPVPIDCKPSDKPRDMTASKRAVRDANFRRNVFGSDPKCIVTGETVNAVLQAAHIYQVAKDGDDLAVNGLVMRADIHRLFDEHILTLSRDGTFTMKPIHESYKHLFCDVSTGQWEKPPVIEDLEKRITYIDLRNRAIAEEQKDRLW